MTLPWAAMFLTAPVIPTTTIAPGVHLPMSGLGTWQYNDTVAEAATTLALSLGYTHIDTAWVYKNAAGIGKALAASPRPRSSYFITSKIMGGNATTTLEQHKEVLHLLGTDYVDLLLVHFPGAYDPKTKGFVGSRAARQAQWQAMEKLVVAGAARSLGVSHYCKRHLQDVLDIATVKVAVNQVSHLLLGSSWQHASIRNRTRTFQLLQSC